ncbi:hypothetical protein EXIGLDRAFT_780517 [Exidia glandulosa HHB12029]|uniref:Uncharacterized protein n=1 Tax=Exidia glandulosa HHB12029 TaxID=1314781 RepID=A0A165BKI8_EXIGL|nr:hypothetical protein EXIGLDRAFT_780517 [Exidia glandulosa HHB12029]
MSPRRPPPSPLLLARGPTPARGSPKHRLPTRPAPALPTVSAATATAPGNAVNVKTRALALPSMTALPDTGTLRTSLGGAKARPGPWDAGYAFGKHAVGLQVAVALPLPPRAAVNPMW